MNKKLYIQMFSLHGLIRYDNPELGRDADTGGQIKYVLDFAEELSRHDDVLRVDLFTRLITDKTVSEDYSKPVSSVSEKFRIVRIPCGRPKYIRKELLWPHLDQFIDGTIKFTKKSGLTPDIIHGHYADAGYVGKQLASFYSVPFIFTGHSLGRPKKLKLIAEGMKPDEIDRIYKIEQRISVEEDILTSA
ncbi:MAG: glycosyltransferase, partial [Oligoflexia bacterium]|nr:glycosyltransferase [Oligoflexia bacterium]